MIWHVHPTMMAWHSERWVLITIDGGLASYLPKGLACSHHEVDNGMTRKTRTEIPADTAAQVLFASDRTCCVCRKPEKPVQIHHVDENPANNDDDNLAVLCFDCHHETQIRGGFDRKLDAAQIVAYRNDWIGRVASKRDRMHGSKQAGALGTEILRFLKIAEISDEKSYSLDAEYPQLISDNSASHAEINLCIAGFVTRLIQRFRADAIRSAAEKEEMKKTAFRATASDSLSVSHKIWLFNADLLSIEFVAWSYGAGAAHPNRNTYTLNFQLNPPVQVELEDMFDPSADYLKLLSQYCVADLHKQQPQHFADPQQRAEWLSKTQDDWILSGAGPKRSNYERVVFVRGGMRFFFDEYKVGSYAEGRYEVFIPTSVLTPVLNNSMRTLFLNT